MLGARTYILIVTVATVSGFSSAALSANGDADGDQGAANLGASQEGLIVEVIPAYINVHQGESEIFHAVARDARGADITGNVRWQIVPARLGTIERDGSFTATGAGRGFVRATFVADARVGYGRAMLTVGPASQETAAVDVTPRRVMVMPGGSVDFKAHLVEIEGVNESGSVQWSVEPAELGTIAADGHFVAGNTNNTQGRVEAVMNVQGRMLRGTANVDVERVRNLTFRVDVRPDRATLALGEKRQFEAAVWGPEGLINNADVRWEISPPALGVISAEGVLSVSQATAWTQVNERGNLAAGEVIAHARWRDRVAVGVAKVSVQLPLEGPNEKH